MVILGLPHQNNIQQIGYKLLFMLDFQVVLWRSLGLGLGLVMLGRSWFSFFFPIFS
ncbi:DUF4322 domain-containing protein [Sulfurisphaera ohwakuensis]|uniref:DUF4322 domain-containing protein n=1 Tax=Sulfurisphaera ohwakuensis TaxID=69656 RepID=A0A650CI59_SULOH|nr:DUF4322 domain-containing protein [Sulfurisphaera ohwakuensis]